MDFQGLRRAACSAALFFSAAGISVDVADYVFGRRRLMGLTQALRLDTEHNLPTLFQGALFLIGAWAALRLSALQMPSAVKSSKKWKYLAAVFAYLALDEWFVIHEKAIEPLRDGFNLSGPFYFAWIIPGFVFAGVVALFFARFIRRLPPPVRSRLLLAAAVYVSGALGMEMVSGWHASQHGLENLQFALLSDVEEIMEMAGLLLAVDGLTRYAEGLSGIPHPSKTG